MSANEIQFLNFIESIRKRPAMYIGSLNLRGFNELLEQVFEELQAYALSDPFFEFGIYPDNRVVLKCKHLRVAHFASQLPLWNKNESLRDIQWLKVLIALSGEILITAGGFLLTGKQGDYETAASAENYGDDSVVIDFTIDAEIFKEFKLVYEQLNPFFQQFAYLNPELKIISEDRSGNEFQRNVFHYPKGVFDQLDNQVRQAWHPFPSLKLNIEAGLQGYQYQIGICSNVWPGERLIQTFVGNTEMSYGGSLENGIILGISRAIKTLAKKEQVMVRVNKDAIKKKFACIAVVKGTNFVFETSTHRRLGVPLIKTGAGQIVYEHMMDFYLSNPKDILPLLQDFRTWEEDKNP